MRTAEVTDWVTRQLASEWNRSQLRAERTYCWGPYVVAGDAFGALEGQAHSAGGRSKDARRVGYHMPPIGGDPHVRAVHPPPSWVRLRMPDRWSSSQSQDSVDRIRMVDHRSPTDLGCLSCGESVPGEALMAAGSWVRVLPVARRLLPPHALGDDLPGGAG